MATRLLAGIESTARMRYKANCLVAPMPIPRRSAEAEARDHCIEGPQRAAPLRPQNVRVVAFPEVTRHAWLEAAVVMHVPPMRDSA